MVFSKDQMDLLMKKVASQLGMDEESEPPCAKNKKSKKSSNNNNSNNNNCKLNLDPSQILIILALLTKTLEVESVLIDRDQQIQILLSGSLKQKTQLEKIMDQVGTMPFDEVMKTLLGRY
jgi:hypothetical protein